MATAIRSRTRRRDRRQALPLGWLIDPPWPPLRKGGKKRGPPSSGGENLRAPAVPFPPLRRGGQGGFFPAGSRASTTPECGTLGLVIEDLLRARFPGLLGVLKDFVLHLDDFGNLVHD